MTISNGLHLLAFSTTTIKSHGIHNKKIPPTEIFQIWKYRGKRRGCRLMKKYEREKQLHPERSILCHPEQEAAQRHH